MNQLPVARQRPLNPRFCTIAIDANALNRDSDVQGGLVDRLLHLSTGGTITLIVPKGVRLEILDPRTPSHIQAAAAAMIFTVPVGLNSDELNQLRLVERALQGNARPGKHAADADHLSQAAKYCGYFITHDNRLLDKASNIRSLLPPSLTVVTLVDFLKIFDDYETAQAI